MRYFITIAFSFFILTVSAQKNWFSGSLFSNTAYYVDDDKTGDFEYADRFRSNNYLKLDGKFGKFDIGMQLEGYMPQPILNFNPEFNKEIGLGTFYINYRNKDLNIRVGHFYEQFGSGLILRSWEDRELGLNNALRGLQIRYKPFSTLQLKFASGKTRSGFEVSDGSIVGVDSELELGRLMDWESDMLNLGVSLVSRKQAIEDAVPEFDKVTSSYALRMNYSGKNFYTNLEYVGKSPDALVEFGTVRTANRFKGNALLLNLGYTKPGFGMDASLRRLENMSFYTDRAASGNIYNDKLINYVPGLTRQHDYGLANIYVYQAQPGLQFMPLGKSGEIGGQFDLFYNLKKGTSLGGKYGTKIALNYATWYGLSAEYDISNRRYEADFLKFGAKYFTDINMEVRKKWSPNWSSIITVMDLFYSKKYIEETSGQVRATIGIAESTYKFGKGRSVRLETQHLWTKDDQKNWWSALAEINFSSKVSVYVSDMYNYGNDLRKVHYFSLGGSYSKNRSRISLNYGRQRGGLLCVGGVCRIVPESTGFNLTLHTSF